MQLFEYIDITNQPYDIFYTDCVNTPLHWHYYSEILYITKGTVSITCNNKNTILHPGDLCYLYPLQLHEVNGMEGTLAEHAVLKFDIHTIHVPQTYLSKFYDCFIRRTREEDFCIILRGEQTDTGNIEKLIRQTTEEYRAKKDFYALQIQANLYTLLIELARKTQPDKGVKKDTGTDTNPSFYHILEYIDLHCAEPLEIQDLAGMCHMSYSHFAKRFRENYGRSCKEYITYIRLNKAQDFLLHTDYDINYIAQETGFSDCSHFIRTYKKWRGITPGQERKNLGGGR